MASRKQTTTTTKITVDKAQARFNRVNLAYQEDPDDTRKQNAYRKAKTELAEARRVYRLLRTSIDVDYDGNDAVAQVASIGATTTIT